MTLSERTAVPEFPLFLIQFFLFLAIFVPASYFIVSQSTKTVTTSETFWVPRQMKLLNEAPDGTLVSANWLTLPEGYITVPVESMQKLAEDAEVQVLLTESRSRDGDIFRLHVHYSLKKGDASFYAQRVIERRADTLSWDKNGSVRSELTDYPYYVAILILLTLFVAGVLVFNPYLSGTDGAIARLWLRITSRRDNP